jgi:hypothetical protein
MAARDREAEASASADLRAEVMDRLRQVEAAIASVGLDPAASAGTRLAVAALHDELKATHPNKARVNALLRRLRGLTSSKAELVDAVGAFASAVSLFID